MTRADQTEVPDDGGLLGFDARRFTLVGAGQIGDGGVSANSLYPRPDGV